MYIPKPITINNPTTDCTPDDERYQQKCMNQNRAIISMGDLDTHLSRRSGSMCNGGLEQPMDGETIDDAGVEGEERSKADDATLASRR